MITQMVKYYKIMTTKTNLIKKKFSILQGIFNCIFIFSFEFFFNNFNYSVCVN
jgi:hypothetical protein